MSLVATVVSTFNETLDKKVEAKVEYSVPDSIPEAAEFYDGEEKLLESIQSDVVRKKANSARPVLRDAEEELDWVAVATQIGEDYKPGRKGGFGSVQVSKTDLEEAAASGNIEDLLALLAGKGAKITS